MGMVIDGDSPRGLHSWVGVDLALCLVHTGRSRSEAEGMEFNSGHSIFEAPGRYLRADIQGKE